MLEIWKKWQKYEKEICILTKIEQKYRNKKKINLEKYFFKPQNMKSQNKFKKKKLKKMKKWKKTNIEKYFFWKKNEKKWKEQCRKIN